MGYLWIPDQVQDKKIQVSLLVVKTGPPVAAGLLKLDLVGLFSFQLSSCLHTRNLK